MTLPDVPYQLWTHMAISADRHGEDVEQQRRQARDAERRHR